MGPQDPIDLSQLHGVLDVPVKWWSSVAVALNESAVDALQRAEVRLSRRMIDLPVVAATAQRLAIGIRYRPAPAYDVATPGVP